jgi:calcineurin-like phosphoesterase family protein
MKTFLASDYHFNHVGILKFCPETRPFESVTEMNCHMINRWNQVVGKNDEVFFLGDFAFSESNSEMSNEFIFGELNGSKHLIIGNHDKKNKKVLKLGWASQHDLFTLKRTVDGVKIRFVLCHYPLESWENANHGYLHAHGHCHGNLTSIRPRRFDVGFDSPVLTLGRPIEIERLWAIGQNQSYDPVDHHEGY